MLHRIARTRLKNTAERESDREGGEERERRGEIRWHERVSYPDVSSMHTYTHASVSVYDIHVHIYTYHAAYCNEAEELRIFDSRGYYLHFEINICPYFSSSIYLFGLYHCFIVFFFSCVRRFFFVFLFFFLIFYCDNYESSSRNCLDVVCICSDYPNRLFTFRFNTSCFST